MFEFHYHCDTLLEVAERDGVSISVGARLLLFFFLPFGFFFSHSMQEQRSSLFKEVTHYKECTFCICVPSATSQGLRLIGLLPIAVQISGKKRLPSHLLTIRVQSADIFKPRGEYINLFTFLCHRYNVK